MKPLFDDRDPPPGGLSRLRARLDAAEGQRPRSLWPALGAGLALIAIALGVVAADRKPTLEQALGGHLPPVLARVSSQPVVSIGAGTAVERISVDDQVVLYRASARASAAPAF